MENLNELFFKAIIKEYKLRTDDYLAVRVKYFIFNVKEMGFNDIIEYLQWRV